MLKYLIKNKLRIGILGGSFDPPHAGHVKISQIALKKLKLHYVLWLVTKKNPLKKKPYLKISTRIKLSKKILKKKQNKIKVEYLDKILKSSKTYDLLFFLKKFNKSTTYFFLMGADNFIKIHRWQNWQKIPYLSKIVVFDRQNYSTKAMNSIASKKFKRKHWMFVKFKKINISSSKIRKIW